MGCCGARRDEKEVAQEAKFDYVDLRHFRSRSCINYTAYAWIYLSTFISCASYAADVYTMVTILALNTWSKTLIAANSSLISYQAARIIFTVCICFSFALLGWEWWRAVRVIKSNGVAEAYMNMIALRWSSIRGGPGKDDTGWRRFLLFSRLTGARGKLDYIALFTYFAFKGWVRTLFAEGPRIVVQALTIASIAKLQQGIEKQTAAGTIMDNFWQNVEHIWNTDKLSAITLGTMAFTTVLWILDVIQLLIAACLFLCVLWHIMNGASLRNYCKVRIDRRLGEIVNKKYQKELARDREKRRSLLARQPAIPDVTLDTKKDPEAASTRIEVHEYAYYDEGETPGGAEAVQPREFLDMPNPRFMAPSVSPPSTVYTTSWTPPPMERDPLVPDLGLDAPPHGALHPRPLQRQATWDRDREHASASPPIPLQPLPPVRNDGYRGGYDAGYGAGNGTDNASGNARGYGAPPPRHYGPPGPPRTGTAPPPRNDWGANGYYQPPARTGTAPPVSYGRPPPQRNYNYAPPPQPQPQTRDLYHPPQPYRPPQPPTGRSTTAPPLRHPAMDGFGGRGFDGAYPTPRHEREDGGVGGGVKRSDTAPAERPRNAEAAKPPQARYGDYGAGGGPRDGVV